MTYKVSVDQEHLDWLMAQIKTHCTDKTIANFSRIHGRFDLEIVISVAPQDRYAINDEFLVDMKRALHERTGLLAPVIYLDGDEPRIIREYDPYVDAQTIAELQAIASRSELHLIEAGRLTLVPFPMVAMSKLTQEAAGIRIAPWPRVYADLRTIGVRGEEAAEHLREAMREKMSPLFGRMKTQET